MRSPNHTGRVVGVLLLFHLIAGLTTPYIMLRPLGAALDASAIANGFQVRLAVMLLFVGGGLTIAIAVAGWSTFREYSVALATWLVALAIANFTLQCVENAAWMSLFTFSQEFGKANAGDASLFHLTGIALRMIWKWVHYTHLLSMVSWMFMLGVMLWRIAVVPRVLAVLLPLGLARNFLLILAPAYASPVLLMLLFPGTLLLMIWLIVKGVDTSKMIIRTPACSSGD